MDLLPSDVWHHKVLSFLQISENIKLARTCKDFYELIKPKMYINVLHKYIKGLNLTMFSFIDASSIIRMMQGQLRQKESCNCKWISTMVNDDRFNDMLQRLCFECRLCGGR